jgi:hypothetical protein
MVYAGINECARNPQVLDSLKAAAVHSVHVSGQGLDNSSTAYNRAASTCRGSFQGIQIFHVHLCYLRAQPDTRPWPHQLLAHEHFSCGGTISICMMKK